jgi:SAM-dependent methyltransferase
MVMSMVRAAIFHYGRWLGNGDRPLREVTAVLGASPEERVLDVGCGTGGFCRAVAGDYVGIDVDPDYIAFARWRWRSPRRRFEQTLLDALDPAQAFDKAMLINCLHHLSDGDATSVLERLRQLVRRRLVVVDGDLEAANRLQLALFALDRGDFFRSRAVQRDLLGRYFRIAHEGRFWNSIRTTVQTLFVCEPQP